MFCGLQIQVNIRSKQSAGLGSGMSYERSMDEGGQPFQADHWVKAQDRFQKIAGGGASGQQQPTKSAHMTWVQGQTVNQSKDSMSSSEDVIVHQTEDTETNEEKT